MCSWYARVKVELAKKRQRKTQSFVFQIVVSRLKKSVLSVVVVVSKGVDCQLVVLANFGILETPKRERIVKSLAN